METIHVDKLAISRYEGRPEMGKAAATAVIAAIRGLLDAQEEVNLIFAAAPSQNELLAGLVEAADLAWDRVNAFHMDEYIGLQPEATQRFGNFLKERLFDRLPFRAVHYLDGMAGDPSRECRRYSDLLTRYPTDVVCMGIGENGHIAFNDPHVADFDDPAMVKVVDLDEACRQQQVNDGCFATMDEVPTHALTLTVPTLMAAQQVFCVVPGPNKARAVQHTLQEAITPRYPATILRKHPQARLFLDAESASILREFRK